MRKSLLYKFMPAGTRLLVFLLCCILGYSAFGQSGGPYELAWSTIDGGGEQSSGGPYVLTGTIGQPDAAYSAGGQYELLGGFWPRGPLCFVEFEDFAKFAENWLAQDCSELNNWCDGADLNHVDGVDWSDLRQFVLEWLYYCPYKWPLR